MRKFSCVVSAGCLCLMTVSLVAEQPDADRTAYQSFLKAQALGWWQDDRPPASVEEWQGQREQLRAGLIRAWGGFPSEPCPLNAQVLGQIRRDGYRIERIVFQTLPGVWMTANAWIPERSGESSSAGKLPAVLSVHGHWPGAKQDPVVQSRCIGLAKLGFFVLCVDAFGAGERAIGTKLGEYHGEMTGALLFPTGRPLSGIQVYENRRAVDYLCTRPEVDSERIGITGASGGGNQTMYAGAMDERLRCVVPTCSVGTYQAYLSAACCICEVIPGGLRLTEEGAVLGLSAGRGLMVTSATRDAFQFSVEQAQISVARARAIAGLFPGSQVQHTVIESPHHYNQPMREAMYGWMTLHLKGEGDGSPISEPEIRTEEPESIRCYPGETRPADYVTIPRFAFAEARRLLTERAGSEDRQLLATLERATSAGDRSAILEAAAAPLTGLLGGVPASSPLKPESREVPGGTGLQLEFETEPGLRLVAWLDRAAESGSEQGAAQERLAILLDIDAGAKAVFEGEHARRLRSQGWRVAAAELRATGQFAMPSDRIGHAPDHNAAEWGLWMGRPLLGQWVWDVRRTLDAVQEHGAGAGNLPPAEVMILGIGPAGIVGLTATALDRRITQVIAVNSLASYASAEPYRGQRLGLIVPGILSEFGDVGHIAAMAAPRRVVIAGGVLGGGSVLTHEQLVQQYGFAREVFQRCGGATGELQIVSAEDAISGLRP